MLQPRINCRDGTHYTLPMRFKLLVTSLFTSSVLLIGALSATGASAQAEPDVPHDGLWSATITAADGKRQVARLELRQFSGSWQGSVPTAAGAKGVCKGRKFPVTVQQSNASGLAFTVWGDQVAPACANLTVELTPVPTANRPSRPDDQQFEGKIEPGGRLRLVRR